MLEIPPLFRGGKCSFGVSWCGKNVPCLTGHSRSGNEGLLADGWLALVAYFAGSKPLMPALMADFAPGCLYQLQK
jgi:hypothetical protein